MIWTDITLIAGEIKSEREYNSIMTNDDDLAVCVAALKRLRAGDITTIIAHPSEYKISVGLGSPSEIARMGENYEHSGRMFYVQIEGFEPQLLCAVIPTTERTQANAMSLATTLATSWFWMEHKPKLTESQIEAKLFALIDKAPCVVCTFLPGMIEAPPETAYAASQVSTAFSAALFVEE